MPADVIQTDAILRLRKKLRLRRLAGLVFATPRDGSKLSAVVGLLRREGGATIDQLSAGALAFLLAPFDPKTPLTQACKR